MSSAPSQLPWSSTDLTFGSTKPRSASETVFGEGLTQASPNSRFGIVVLSPSFLSKGWTQYELDGLVTMSVSGKQGLLPLWHGVTKDQVIVHSPSLADKVALNTATSTIAEIAEEISAVVLESKSGKR